MKDDVLRRDLAAYPFRIDIVPRFGDMDPNRHLNNVAIARFYEEGRVRLHWNIRNANPGIGSFHVLVAHVAIDYLGEGHWPDPLRLGAGIAAIGGRSYRIGLALFQADVCIGLCDSVLLYRSSAPSSTLPPVLRAALEPLRLRQAPEA